jgi:hypothetical protein
VPTPGDAAISRRPKVSIAYHENCNITFIYFFPFDPGLRDLEPDEYPSSFTVVPILALDTATFGQILYTGRKETHLDLCKMLIEFDPDSGESVSSF